MISVWSGLLTALSFTVENNPVTISELNFYHSHLVINQLICQVGET